SCSCSSLVFFLSSRRRHTRFSRDWSSDVCSSDLKWLIFPAMVGGAALLADGMITPPITVSSALEGLNIYFPNLPTVPIVLFIIRSEERRVGKESSARRGRGH